jgi:hypothetical protein
MYPPSRVPTGIKPGRSSLGDSLQTFWYGIEEDAYLKASALGSAVVMIKNLIGATGTHDANYWNQCV